MEYIYVLECDKNKYFVGKTNDICKTFNEHVKKQHDLTKPYTSIKIVEINYVAGMFDEQSKTLEYMAKYGDDNVRGGPYNKATLTDEQKRSINASIVSATKTYTNVIDKNVIGKDVINKNVIDKNIIDKNVIDNVTDKNIIDKEPIVNTKYTWNRKKTFGVKWTEDEEKILVKEMTTDKNYKRIAESHNRTEIAIQSRVRLLVNREIKNGKTTDEACKCLNITDKEYKFFDRFTYNTNK